MNQVNIMSLIWLDCQHKYMKMIDYDENYSLVSQTKTEWVWLTRLLENYDSNKATTNLRTE